MGSGSPPSVAAGADSSWESSGVAAAAKPLEAGSSSSLPGAAAVAEADGVSAASAALGAAFSVAL